MVLAKSWVASIQIQARDFALLRGLFESRVMSTDHATTLFFDGKAEAAKKRLQKLKSARLIAERPRRTFEPSVLFLTRAGLKQLESEGILAEYPSFSLPALDRRARVSDLTIHHELEVMDVKAAFHSSAKAASSFSVARFSTWPLLHEFKAYRPGPSGMEVSVKPDGFILLHETDGQAGKFEHTFFLEVDRSTETQAVLVDRAGCYLDYYKSGGFAVRNGAARDQYKEYPFRVLMVMKTTERRNNTAQRLAQNTPPILTQTWLTTFSEVTADPLAAIWIQPKDYREATMGTPFHSDQPARVFGYRRQPEREAFVEARIKKRRLLGDD